MPSWSEKLTGAAQNLAAAEQALATVVPQVPGMRCAAAFSTHASAQEAVSELRGKEAGLVACAEHSWHIYELNAFRKAAAAHCTGVLTQHQSLLHRLGIFKQIAAELRGETNRVATSLTKVDRKAYNVARAELVAQQNAVKNAAVQARVRLEPALLEEFYACYRKRAHPTPAHAQRHLQSLTAAANVGGVLQTYQCCYCTGWHVGHQPRVQTNSEKRDRTIRAAQLLLRDEVVAHAFLTEKGLPLSLLAEIKPKG